MSPLKIPSVTMIVSPATSAGIIPVVNILNKNNALLYDEFRLIHFLYDMFAMFGKLTVNGISADPLNKTGVFFLLKGRLTF